MKITTPISQTEKELHDLQVKKCIEKSDVYNIKIKELQAVVDFFNWGIKQK